MTSDIVDFFCTILVQNDPLCNNLKEMDLIEILFFLDDRRDNRGYGFGGDRGYDRRDDRRGGGGFDRDHRDGGGFDRDRRGGGGYEPPRDRGKLKNSS